MITNTTTGGLGQTEASNKSGGVQQTPSFLRITSYGSKETDRDKSVDVPIGGTYLQILNNLSRKDRDLPSTGRNGARTDLPSADRNVASTDRDVYSTDKDLPSTGRNVVSTDRDLYSIVPTGIGLEQIEMWIVQIEICIVQTGIGLEQIEIWLVQ